MSLRAVDIEDITELGTSILFEENNDFSLHNRYRPFEQDYFVDLFDEWVFQHLGIIKAVSVDTIEGGMYCQLFKSRILFTNKQDALMAYLAFR